MSNITEKKFELYKKQKYLRDLTMANSSYEQKEKIRKEQDDLYKRFKFYQGYTDTLEKNKEKENARLKNNSSKKM